jgi:hypothetical protein
VSTFTSWRSSHRWRALGAVALSTLVACSSSVTPTSSPTPTSAGTAAALPTGATPTGAAATPTGQPTGTPAAGTPVATVPPTLGPLQTPGPTPEVTPGTEPSPTPEPTPEPSPTAGPPILPAGVQLAGEGLNLLQTGAFRATAIFDGLELFFGFVDGPVASVREDNKWRVRQMDNDPYVPPGGSGKRFQAFAPRAAASNDSTVVVVGTSLWSPGKPRPAIQGVIQSLIWSTTDGTTYQRFDPAEIAGGPGHWMSLHGVAATTDGFIVVGGTGRIDGTQPSEAIVLGSADGRSWREIGRFPSRWSTSAARVFPDVGGSVVIEGVELACDGTGERESQVTSFLGGGPRLWRGAPDLGSNAPVTWEAVDLAPADSALHVQMPVPATRNECPPLVNGFYDIGTLAKRYESSGEIVGSAGGRLVAISKLARTVLTTDLTEWTVADLPGALSAGTSISPYNDVVKASLVTADVDGLVVRIVLPYRDDMGHEHGVGCQVNWWRTSDVGASWQRGDLARPVSSCRFTLFEFHEGLDDSILVTTLDPPQLLTPGPSRLYRTRPEPLVEWGSCTPGPSANCDFATLQDPGEGASTNWRKISLYGATLRNANLAGANLSDAQVVGVIADGDFSGATLQRARISVGRFAADFSHADLTGAFFSTVAFEGDFRGADLTNAQLFDVTFHGDMTGAKVSGANFFADTTFEPGTICPNGKNASSAKGPAACGL